MQAPVAIGLDVGGSKILSGLVARDGAVLAEHEVPSPDGSEEGVLAALDEAVDALLDERVAAIGYGIPANLERGTGRILRAMNLPLPFEITQTPKHVLIAFEFAHATRTIFLDGTPHLEDLDFWMGDARGKWEGDTLVVNTVSLGDRTWFDQAGNFHSDALKVVERFTPTDATHIAYEATIEDSKVFTRPWKINLVMYRRLEKSLELLDYECAEHVYEQLFKKTTGKP